MYMCVCVCVCERESIDVCVLCVYINNQVPHLELHNCLMVAIQCDGTGVVYM